MYDGCDLTKEESRLLILTQALRNRFTDVALQSSLTLIDCHLPYVSHGSKHHFLKTIPDQNEITCYYCPLCLTIINFENSNQVQCVQCNNEYTMSRLNKDGNYFFYLPLEPQLKDLINSKHFQDFRKDCNESDVVNGRIYCRLREEHIISEHDITIQWNTDGVNVFNSSIRSIWPILVMVNELPYRLRKNNMLLCGLWFGEKKPAMNLFLRPFIDELIRLHEYGFQSSIFLNKEPIRIRVHTLLSPVDSSARPAIQNIKQYNGMFGCSYCLHKGENITIGRGKSRVYCGEIKRLRTTDQHNRDAELADGNLPIRGVKGYSVVSLIPLFHISKCFPPEYLHSVLEGVVKMLVSAIFNSENSKKEWYLGRMINAIDERLKRIKPPCEITRTPGTLKHHKRWKASEWKSFLLYYLLICFKNFLPLRYMKHWLLLVYSINTFSKLKITEAEFMKAREALRKFVFGVEELYGKEYMKFNVHILLHIPQAIQNFGALWAWSTFPYEHYNGVLKKLFNGTQYVPEQICKFYTRFRFINIASEIFSRENCSERGKKLFRSLMKECGIKRCIQYGDFLRIFGAPLYVNLTIIQKLVIEEVLEGVVDDAAEAFKRFVYKNVLYHTSNDNRLIKRNNSTIETTDGRFMVILDFLIVKLSETGGFKHVIIGKELQRQNKTLFNVGNVSSSEFSYIVKETNNIMCCMPYMIKVKCVNIQCDETELCLLPIVNNLETD